MALTTAAIVGIAASNGGTTAQDLKTAYLVGGTPRRQQIALFVGVLTSALFIGLVLVVLNRGATAIIPETHPGQTVSVLSDETRDATHVPVGGVGAGAGGAGREARRAEGPVVEAGAGGGAGAGRSCRAAELERAAGGAGGGHGRAAGLADRR